MRVFFFALALAVAVAAAGTASATDSLCYVPGCDCNGPDVVCNCVENQVRRVGQTQDGFTAPYVDHSLIHLGFVTVL